MPETQVPRVERGEAKLRIEVGCLREATALSVDSARKVIRVCCTTEFCSGAGQALAVLARPDGGDHFRNQARTGRYGGARGGIEAQIAKPCSAK